MKYKITKVHPNDSLFKLSKPSGIIGKIGFSVGKVRQSSIHPEYSQGTLSFGFTRKITIPKTDRTKYVQSTELLFFRAMKVEKAGN